MSQFSVLRRDRGGEYAPRADDCEVVFDALVVDEAVGLEPGHGDFRVADAGGGSGHAGRETLGGSDRMGGPSCDVEHRLARSLRSTMSKGGSGWRRGKGTTVVDGGEGRKSVTAR